MTLRKRYLIPGLAVAASAAGLIVVPSALADCTSSGGLTVCAQGTVEGPSGVPESTGPYWPYPCEEDWLCDDGGVSIILDPGRPDGGIDWGRPGRPGIGPR